MWRGVAVRAVSSLPHQCSGREEGVWVWANSQNAMGLWHHHGSLALVLTTLAKVIHQQNGPMLIHLRQNICLPVIPHARTHTHTHTHRRRTSSASDTDTVHRRLTITNGTDDLHAISGAAQCVPSCPTAGNNLAPSVFFFPFRFFTSVPAGPIGTR